MGLTEEEGEREAHAEGGGQAMRHRNALEGRCEDGRIVTGRRADAAARAWPGRSRARRRARRLTGMPLRRRLTGMPRSARIICSARSTLGREPEPPEPVEG